MASGNTRPYLARISRSRAAVDPDPDGDAPLAAGVGHRLHPVLAPDISGVDAHLVRSGGDGLEGQAYSQSGCQPPRGWGSPL